MEFQLILFSCLAKRQLVLAYEGKLVEVVIIVVVVCFIISGDTHPI